MKNGTNQATGTKGLLVVIGFLLLGLAGRAPGYELFPWRWPDSDMPISYYVNSASIPSSYGGTLTAETFADAVHGAFDAWADVPDSYITFDHEGTGTAYTPYVPGATIHMTGSSFDNHSTNPHSLADMANLRLIFEGEGETDSFEAAGRDFGAALAGFDENFTLGTLQLGSEDGVGRIRLVDAFDNQPAWSGSEALYVIELIMGAGAAVDLNGLNLYYLNDGDPKQLFLGDANLDGIVNDVDLTALATHWQQAGSWAAGDFNGDGLVDDLDLTILAMAWPGPGAPGDFSAVPEPTALALIALAGPLLARGRRRAVTL